MDKNSIWKWLILVVLICGSFWVVWPPEEKVKYGLDLQGGTSFTVEIDQDAIAKQMREDFEGITEETIQSKLPKAKQDALDRALEVIRNRVDGLGISEPIIYPEKGGRIIVQLPGVGEEKREEAAKQIQSVAFLAFRLVHEKNEELIGELFDKNLAPEGYVIVESNQRGTDRQFYKRDKVVLSDEKMDAAYHEKLRRFHAPAGYDLLLQRTVVNDQELFTPVFVSIRREVTGDALKNAMVNVNPINGKNEVDLEFKSAGARKFAKVTGDYAPGGSKNLNSQVGRQLAIVLDNSLYSSPVIREPIPNGRAQITGDFRPEEAARLANVLRAGSLPAPVKIVEKRVVDPSLGADSIRSGINAGLYGCIAIAVMMASYYLLNGIIANIALVLTAVLLPLGAIVVAGFLGVLFGGLQGGGGKVGLPVLTLPGIAGIALSIGMAVDANVLIFERIREELRAGKGFGASVEAGFDRAFTAIFDSNMTTIITAVIMFAAGSGPVRGYAITLAAGLIINLYTSVVVTRMCYDAIGSRTINTGLLKMFSMIKETSIDFIRLWKPALSLSVVIIVVSWSMMFIHGAKDPAQVFGVDFIGGTSLTMGFNEQASVEDVRKSLETAGIRNPMIQYQKGMDVTGKDVLQIKVGSVSEGELTIKTLTEKFPKSAYKILQQDDVGPQVGKELKVKATWALSIALVAMIIYIAFRFEFGFGLGAIAAVFHDVLMTIGICHLCGFQMNMTIIAAVLTIIGYSVNDTIVIFDRIRENLRLIRNKSFVEVCNLSVNQTLARTLLTNSFTMVSVLCLLFIGGGAIRDFSFPMFIGMIAGTYSTVYIATPIVLMWHKFERPDMGKK
ncbi:MAG: hypothetical protein A2283_00760 [Lentisphaerae bacterium RIFOXYA12_FULL_48_11]|nr:MAG: hypothetical protein A2283_00760 [Lentisphaerae bacterium RIFOXYA12_FULL_48_11]